jgi:hypothetical protein
LQPIDFKRTFIPKLTKKCLSKTPKVFPKHADEVMRQRMNTWSEKRWQVFLQLNFSATRPIYVTAAVGLQELKQTNAEGSKN